MTPGRELDALVAEKVMGVKPKRLAIATNDGGESAACVEDPIHGPFFSEHRIKEWLDDGGAARGYKLSHWEFFKPYSTDIAAAWEVVEKIRQQMMAMSIAQAFHTKDKSWSYCAVVQFFGIPREEMGLAPTAPHAICLAALKAVGAL